MPQPAQPKIYHIVHVDRLPSIVAGGFLWADSVIAQRASAGTIGMSSIKQRRLTLQIECLPGLCVGDCVPFYLCPRSVMLYLLYRGNHPELTYQGGQSSVIHLEADMAAAVAWAERHGIRWAFTLSNAGACYVESRCNLDQLKEINWDAVQTDKWSGPGIPASMKEGKQAEFLLQERFPWSLVEKIGVASQLIGKRVINLLQAVTHRPTVEIRTDWYY